MKLGLQIFSWTAIVISFFAIISGLTALVSDPTNAYYSLLGGALFGVEGTLALIYINRAEKQPGV